MGRDRAGKVARGLMATGALGFRIDDPYRWENGVKSPVNCDCSLLLTSPKTRDMVDRELVELVRETYPECDVIIGMSMGGITHAACLAQLMELPMGYVRPEVRNHEKRFRLEGRAEAGSKAVIIDDVFATGSSITEAAVALRNMGIEVLGLASIFTFSLSKGFEKLRGAGLQNVSLTDYSVAVREAVACGDIDDTDVAALLRFRDSL